MTAQTPDVTIDTYAGMTVVAGANVGFYDFYDRLVSQLGFRGQGANLLKRASVIPDGTTKFCHAFVSRNFDNAVRTLFSQGDNGTDKQYEVRVSAGFLDVQVWQDSTNHHTYGVKMDYLDPLKDPEKLFNDGTPIMTWINVDMTTNTILVRFNRAKIPVPQSDSVIGTPSQIGSFGGEYYTGGDFSGPSADSDFSRQYFFFDKTLSDTDIEDTWQDLIIPSVDLSIGAGEYQVVWNGVEWTIVVGPVTYPSGEFGAGDPAYQGNGATTGQGLPTVLLPANQNGATLYSRYLANPFASNRALLSMDDLAGGGKRSWFNRIQGSGSSINPNGFEMETSSDGAFSNYIRSFCLDVATTGSWQSVAFRSRSGTADIIHDLVAGRMDNEDQAYDLTERNRQFGTGFQGFGPTPAPMSGGALLNHATQAIASSYGPINDLLGRSAYYLEDLWVAQLERLNQTNGIPEPPDSPPISGGSDFGRRKYLLKGVRR